MSIALGIALILALTAATGYFVAQEFAYVAVDRNALKDLAAGGDAPAERALEVTSRLSFTLSAAQFGITVTDRLRRAAYDIDGSSSSASPAPTSGSEM